MKKKYGVAVLLMAVGLWAGVSMSAERRFETLGHARADERGRPTKTVRATELDPSVWSSVSSGALGDIIVEFRKGDEIPVDLSAEGDLVETSKTATSYVRVKRDFWLKLQASDVLISFDGSVYRAFTDALTGSLEAEAKAAASGGPANGLNIVFKSFVR